MRGDTIDSGVSLTYAQKTYEGGVKGRTSHVFSYEMILLDSQGSRRPRPRLATPPPA